jgi:cyclohexanone monooxygenase
VADVAQASLFAKANSWYVGANIPGKPRVVAPYTGGQPLYRERFEAVVDAGYEGFEFRS